MGSVNIIHVHNFNIELTDLYGDYDGRVMCRCGKLKPIPAQEPDTGAIKNINMPKLQEVR